MVRSWKVGVGLGPTCKQTAEVPGIVGNDLELPARAVELV